MTPQSQPRRHDGALRLQRLIDEADERVLRVSPPYATSDMQRTFIAGYETALKDIAFGDLRVMGITDAF